MNHTIYSKVVNRKVIEWLKRKRDSLYSRSVEGKKTLGNEDQWTILTGGLNHPIVYSGGVGKNISFELELIKSYQASVFAFDPSVTGIKTIQSLPLNPHLRFYPIALSNKDGILKLNYPIRPEEGSFTKDVSLAANHKSIEFPCKKISTLMKELDHIRIDILKIDIEGSEYEVLEDIMHEKIEIDQICVEFHHFFKNIQQKQTQEIIKKLKQAGYILFHKRELDFSFYHQRLLSRKV